MTLIFGGYPIDNGGGGGSTAITWKYPEMAMCLVDKDKFDAIDWESATDEIKVLQCINAFTDSILVGINECELIYPDTFLEDIQTREQTDVDLNKNNQRIATMTISTAAITFSNLAGELSNKNIQFVMFGKQPNGDYVRAMGINTDYGDFTSAITMIYVRDYMNVGGEG